MTGTATTDNIGYPSLPRDSRRRRIRVSGGRSLGPQRTSKRDQLLERKAELSCAQAQALADDLDAHSWVRLDAREDQRGGGRRDAIMLIDRALQVQRRDGIQALAAIKIACMERFRPIMMTTLAALLGALPLALGTGNGAELRQLRGVSIVGGLLVSQLLTLYTTPVVYLYLDRFRHLMRRASIPMTVPVNEA